MAAKPDNGLGLSMVWQGWGSMEGDWYMMLRMKTDEENQKEKKMKDLASESLTNAITVHR